MRYHRTPLETALRGAETLDDLLTRADFEAAYTADPDFHVVFSDPSEKIRRPHHLNTEVFDRTLTDYARALVASWSQRFAAGESDGLNPVALVTAQALAEGCGVDEITRRIVAAAEFPEDRATARSALLGIGRTDLLPAIRSFVGYDDIAETEKMYEPLGAGEFQAPLTQAERDERAKSSTLGISVFKVHHATYPLFAWDPARFPSLDAVPAAVRPLFPAVDMPSVKRYIEGEGPFFFDEHELDVLMMMHGDGHTRLAFTGRDAEGPYVLADIGAQVAMTRWQRDLEFHADDLERIEATRETLGMFLEAGGTIDYELMLDVVDERPQSVAVVGAAALMAADRAPSPADKRTVFRAVEAAATTALCQGYGDDVIEALMLLRDQVRAAELDLGRSGANDAWEL